MPTNALAPDTLGPTVAIGELLVEIVATTPGKGFTEPQPLFGPYPSGAPAIFIDQCARMGGQAAMVGAVGADDFGRVVRDRLVRDGVDCSAVAEVTELPTGSAFVRYRADGARDFVFNIAASAAGRLAVSEPFDRLADRAGHLHLMGSGLAMPGLWLLVERALPRIRARGGSFSFDPNLRKELQADATTRARFARAVDMADLLLPSGEELAATAGTTDEDEAVARLLRRGVKEIVLKRGPAGATAFLRDGSRIDARAFLVEEVDPTGAGDCFGGAYLTARRLGFGVAEALDYGCAAGARNVTRRGPMEGAGTRADLEDVIGRLPRRT